jgi:hypothetical protein
MNIKDLIFLAIRYDNFNSILDLFPEQSQKGFIFERLFDICIKFGLFEIFQSFDHIIGNVNYGKPKKLTSLSEYILENVVSGNSGGCSDISLHDKITDTYIFISSKFPKSTEDIKKEKSVSYYDLQNILSVIMDNRQIYKNYKIYLLVPDKKLVLEKVKKSNKSSHHITKHMTEYNIFDKTDLQKYFTKLRLILLKHIDKGEINFDELFFSPKSNLELRFHQELITDKTLELMRESHKSFLWGCKCRSGKTFMTGGLIMKYFEFYKKTNVLIITPAPTETAPQFTDDLFRKFKDFEQLEIHPIHGSESLEKIVLGTNNIFIMSKQLLQRYIEDETIVQIQNLKLDIIIFDENHFSGTTDLSKSILDSYSSKNTVKVYLTATYNKPLQEWNIPKECQMYWDIEDESICKSVHDYLILKTDSSIYMRKLFDKHGEEFIRRTIKKFEDNGSSIEDIFLPYKLMPELYLITTLFDSKRYDEIKKEIMGTKYGFCFDVLFALNEQKTRFQFENEVKTVLRFISGSNRERDFKDGDKSIFSRIFGICSENDTRQPFTQIWFLPSDYINEISICLSNLMKEDRILKKYNIMCVNRKNKQLAKDVKDEIIKQEKIAKHENKDGLILLAGNMLTLGITLNLCDLVILLNNVLSFDKVLQQMYRCMTEGEHKKYGFVVDLSISRVLNTCINYTIHNNDRGINEKISYLIENHLITIDDDMMKHQKLNTDEIVSKLMNIWKLDPVNSFKSLLRNLDDECIEFDSSTQKTINKIFMNSSEKVLNAKIEISNSQELPSGKHFVKNESDISTVSKDKEKEVKPISFTKDVLPYIIPLTCILTISNTNKDFVRMLNDIQENPELLDIFDDMCLKWWNEKDLINFIKEIIRNYFDKKTNTYNISIQFKMSLQSLIDKPKELLELIDSCLKPKQKEKQENGEVFTPMCLVFEMLDNLDKHYIEKYGKSIFSEKNFKWFDPACGMGNFPVAVYLRLIEGLKSQIPNEDERKKHIIENMLYMSELNKKNVFICHQIFNMNNRYKLNIYEGDTLELDIVGVWGIQLYYFDVILGNIPFNKGGIRSHTGKQLGDKNETIWPNFIEQSFEWLKPDGFLVLINPLSWLKKSHSLHNKMLEKHIIWLKLWDDSQSKYMIAADIPISLYILQNTFNGIHKKTEVISEIKRKKLTTVSIEYLNKNYTIPLAFHSIFDKLIQFIEKHNCNLEYKTKTIKSSGTKAKIPTKYTLEDMWAIDTYTLNDGILVKKATEEHPDANKRKLIIANKRGFKGAFIDEGKLSLTGNHKFYILGNNLELIKKIMDFNICIVISDYLKYGQSFLDNEAFKYLPDIRKLGITDITEDEFYKLIGLRLQEINQIKNPLSNNELDEPDEPYEDKPKKVKKVKIQMKKSLSSKLIINI